MASIKYSSMPKGKFAPQNREITQKVVKVKAMPGVQFQNASTANTSAAIFKKQKDNTVKTTKSISISGVRKGSYRFKS